MVIYWHGRYLGKSPYIAKQAVGDGLHILCIYVYGKGRWGVVKKLTEKKIFFYHHEIERNGTSQCDPGGR